ncbi:MAG TPA: hypothetical protein DHV29_12770 [Bacteroidales bacterium]|nr:hypothetical protein [Bacteroidales bacterium]HCB63599.1 hypothetical protein [Bacteroidales bacterium]HCY24348.1 hypothetical protein [Bacteroidales bacterium]
MPMVTRFLTLVSLIILTTNISIAQMPFITDDAGTQGSCNHQLEFSYGNDFDNTHRCTNNTVELAPVYTFGVVERIDVVIGYPFVFINEFEDSSISRISGFSDVGVEVKWRFLEHDKWALAIKPGFSLPTGNSALGLGNGKLGYSGFLISTMTFGKLAINTNAGYIRNENLHGDAKDIWHASAGFDFAATEILHFAFNGGAEKNPDVQSDTPSAFGLVGLYYFLSDDNELAFGYKCGLTEVECDHSFIVGLTLRF